jgi:DNA-binding CsgD family transcriptional regulator
MNLRVLFFLLFVKFSFGQNSIILDSTFESKEMKTELLYYYDSLNSVSNTTILDQKFQQNNTAFPGLTNANFWYKLTLENKSSLQKKLVFRINTEAIKDFSIFKKVDTTLIKLFSFKEKSNKNLNIPITLFSKEIGDYYFETHFSKSVYLPFQLFSKREYIKFEQNRLLILGLYYGFCLMVLLINLFFYFTSKDVFFILYCGLLVVITLVLAELDGMFYILFGNAFWLLYIAIFLNWLLLVFSILFISNALELDKNYPKHCYIGLPFVFLNGLSYLLYVWYQDLFWYGIGEAIINLGIGIYLFIAILHIKKNILAKYIILGYLVVFLAGVLYSLPSQFGVTDFEVPDYFMKIGGFIEMVVFLYAISLRYKNVVVENQIVSKKLSEISNSLDVKNLDDKDVFEQFIIVFELSKREEEVIKLLFEGFTNKKISSNLNIEETTVKYHVSKIFRKLNISKRTEIIFVFSEFKREYAHAKFIL